MGSRIQLVSLDKPKLGSTCNGCGICCISEVCQLGLELGDDKHCKALINKIDGSYACGLVSDPYRFIGSESRAQWMRIDEIRSGYGESAAKQMYAQLLGAGRGFNSSLDF